MKVIFTHNSNNFEKIIRSGILKLGSNVSKEERKYSGGKPLPYIYMNIFFVNDLINESYNISLRPGTLIFNDNLLHDYKCIFNDAHYSHTNYDSIIIKKNDPNTDKKLKEIRKKINEKSSDPKFKKFPYELNHEILFDRQINIKKYLIGIICDKNDIKHIEQLSHKYGYNKIKIITVH